MNINKLEFNKKKLLNRLIKALFLMLFIRLVFFLQDWTNDTIEYILIWIIFVVSLFTLSVYLYPQKENILSAIKKYQDKIYLVIFIYVVELAFLIENGLPFRPVFLFSLLLAAIGLVTVSLLLPKKISKIFDISFMIVYAIYVFSQDMYYRVFSDFFSFIELGTWQEGVESSEDMYVFSFLHLFLLIALVTALFFYIKLKKTSHLSFSRVNLKRLIKLQLFLLVLVNLNIKYPINLARLHLSEHYLYYSMFNKEEFGTTFGTINLLTRDVYLIMKPSFTTARDIKYIDNFYENDERIHIDNDYTGIFEDKNLLFIVVESFDSIAVDPVLTPSIYKLKSEGIDFQNHFTPVFPRTTCDTEVILNTSIIPSITAGPTCYVYNDNTYSKSLAEMFNNNDYLTNGFHNNYKEFYTRDLVYEGFGYDNFYGQFELWDLDEYSKEESNDEKRFDSVFYEKSSQYAISTTEPFFSSLLTISGHSPYTMDNIAVEKHYDYVDDFYGDTIPETIKMFIASQIEVDIMMEKIFEDLEANGLLEDTVIIFTNDHYPYTLNESDYVDYKNIEEDFMKQQGVLYIWSSDIEHKEVTKLTSSFDILPSIVNLFALGNEYQYYVGNDFFSDNYDPIVYFKDYSIFDGVNHIEFSDSDATNTQMLVLAESYYELSKKLLRVDYFKDR